VRDNARATRDQRVLDFLDYSLSSDDCVFSQQTPQQARTFEAYATARSRIADRLSGDRRPTKMIGTIRPPPIDRTSTKTALHTPTVHCQD
jgi:hypothetical protein